MTRQQASLERWIAVTRLGVVPFLLVQTLLIPPVVPVVMAVVAVVFAVSGTVVLSLYVRRQEVLAHTWVQILIFSIDCAGFATALADYARPNDLTWVTFILVLLSAAVRWDVRGAVTSVLVFAAADLPLEVLTPAYTHLTFSAGTITFKIGLMVLLAVFFGSQFKSFRRVSLQREAQAEDLRVQAQSVQRSEAELRVIFDTALMGMITMDEAGFVKDWNDMAEQMFGWPRAEVVGRRLSETVVPVQHRAAHEAGLAAYRATREGPVLGQVLDITAMNRQGQEFPIELSISPASTMEGRTTFIAFLRDTRERKRAEALHALQLGVTRALAEASSVDEAAPPILGELGSRLDLVLSQWWEVDPSGSRMTWKDSWFAQGLAAVDFIHDSQGIVFAKGEGLPGRTWALGEATVIEDILLDSNFPRLEDARQAGLRSAVAFPILNRLEVTGVVELFSTRPGLFDGDVVRILASVGSQVGQFLERRRAEEALRLAGQRITAVLENVADGIITTDDAGRVQSLNASARRLFGYSPEQVLGKPVEVLMAEADRGDFFQRLPRAVDGNPESAGVELSGRRVDGSEFPVEVRASEMSLSGKRLNIISLRDISDRRAQTEALQFQALHDDLTGLPNRALLNDRLSQAVAVAGRDSAEVAILVLDLDRFKEVNDTMGHAEGDGILQEVAARIREFLREADTVARLGGDEFAVLPAGPTGREGATRTAQKVSRAFNRPFIVDDRRFDMRASIGVALFPDHGRDAESLMRCADVAMYVAKRAKKPFEIYDASQDADTFMRLALMADLRQAGDRGEFILNYQPKIDLRTDRVVSAEALLRWVHPERGTLTPDQFLAQAEQTEMINAVTSWVLNAALAQARAWMDGGVELAIAVNMSAANLLDGNLPGIVAGLLTTWRIPAESLIIEVTEGIAMDSGAEARLHELSAMGVRLSVDDFGTGYSSLAYLKRLPMEELKIDRSFVSGMDTNPDDAAIVRPTIDLAHNLGLRVAAEGVESQAALDLLRAYGCDFAQGHAISPPLTGDHFLAWLAAYDHRAGRGSTMA
ncbi:MAG: EAL domain-containing protein [Candidatus Dormibacteria bacterium]